MTDFPTDFERRGSGRRSEKSTFAGFLGRFDFRLFQHNWSFAEVDGLSREVCFTANNGH
jgi:hypothetical protein